MFNRPRKQPYFKDLVSIPDWQKMQDMFSAVTSINLRTLDPEGNLLTAPSGTSTFCEKFLKNSTYGLELCGHSFPTFLGGKAVVDRNLSFACPPGFHHFFSPLRLDSQVAAYVVLGPVILVMRKPKEQYQKLADELNVDLGDLWGAIVEVRVISFHRAQTLMELLVKISEFILTLAYENIIIGKKLSGLLPAKFEEVLNIILDLALQISGADMGSIMLLDKNKEDLTIRAARGLSDKVIKDTRLKVGNGISGTAVMENRPILIDDRLADNRIQKYLNRPYLKSSMVLPIGTQDKAIGAINLGALEVSPVRFNSDNLESMNKVVNLAIDALYTPFKKQVPDKAAYLEQLL